jgi:cyclic pyranopterin phosphate synthase
MPAGGVAAKPHDAMLSLEEIAAFVRVAAGEGFSHIRLTGGEPLVRLGICDLVRDLVAIPGIEKVAMTTNGILLPKFASKLAEAGLERVNISLDTLDPERFAWVTRGGKIADVFAGIDAALEVGFKPVKINAVVVRSMNQDLLGFMRLTIDKPLHVRFIEYMPVGETTGETDGCGEDLGWTAADTIPNEELLGLLNEQALAAGLGELESIQGAGKPEGWGPARYYQLPGAQGTIGLISALSRHFCGECNRLRLTSEGLLRPCLFSDEEYDVRAPLRAHDDASVRRVLLEALGTKPDEHHNRVGTERMMSQIGG